MEHVGAVAPWVGRVVGRLFRSLAMLEDFGGAPEFHSGFVEAAGLAAIAVEMARIHQYAPKPQPGVWSGVTGLWGMGDLGACRD